jgi:small subunit ribosomal protein S9
VSGGGLSAQAAAVALGAARALVSHDADLRRPLKAADLLKRDPREKERMKYGLAKRRKRFQWTKR